MGSSFTAEFAHPVITVVIVECNISVIKRMHIKQFSNLYSSTTQQTDMGLENVMVCTQSVQRRETVAPRALKGTKGFEA